MKKIKITAGIIWAIAGLILILVLFPFLNSFSKSMAGLPFMKINPRYSGGEIAFREINAGCTLVVRKPVFDGLISERKKGFVQLDWRGEIPDIISDTIDYDRDNNPDFRIELNTEKAETMVIPISYEVSGTKVSTPTTYGWTLRVNLKRK